MNGHKSAKDGLSQLRSVDGWERVEGSPSPLGATWVESEQAWNFSVFSRHADSMTLLLYGPDDDGRPLFELRLGIPMMGDDLPVDLDLTIDGADEVDPAMNLIKGGGGAHLREKIVAQVSRREIIVVDASKLSPRLGTLWPVPVEVIPFGWLSQARFLEELGARWKVRGGPDGSPFVTDSGHRILDCHFGPIADAQDLASRLDARAGIVEHGLFIGLATDLVVAGEQGIDIRSREA